ncbi:MAG: hypothetical protein ACRDE8_09040 [Ginsengibacter sp.]
MAATFMRRILLIFFVVGSFNSEAQKFSVFENINFDSTYSVIALSSSFRDYNKDSKAYSFLVNDVEDLNKIKKEWTVKTIKPTISIEEYSISINIVKDKQLVNSQLLIYPNQGIIKARNNWYYFDMKKFNEILASHPLNYHSQTFKFDTDLDFAFFYDSIQNTPSYLFLFEPYFEFEGYFNIIAPRTADPDSPVFVLSEINKELEKLSPTTKFRAQQVLNDKFNLEHTDKVKIKVECSKKLYGTYNNKNNIKEDWIPSTFDTKVIFKD